MLENLNQFIIRCSFSFGKVLLLFIGFFGSLQALLFIGERFGPHAGGALPFDLQNWLTVEEIFAQLPNYTDQAFTLYFVFASIDFLFPLFAGLFLAVLWAWVLRHTQPRWYDRALQSNLFVLLLIPTIFDWVENVMFLSLILSWPNELMLAAQAGVLAKKAKLVTTWMAQGSTALILLFGLIVWASRRLGR